MSFWLLCDLENIVKDHVLELLCDTSDAPLELLELDVAGHDKVSFRNLGGSGG